MDYGAEAATQVPLHSEGTISQLGQMWLNVKGEPLRYPDQEYFLTGIDDTSYDTVFFNTARQVGKSLNLAVKQTVLSIAIPNYETLYVSSSFKQTKEYSQTRVDPLIRESDYIQKYFLNTACKKGTETKSFSNGSRMVFRYAFYNADRIRGISAAAVCVDEAQDILWDNVPVIEQVLAHAKPPTNRPDLDPFFKKKIYSGTPKSHQNTMQSLWDLSTQCVWVVPCYSCGHWNQLTEKSIGKFGTICTGRVHATGKTVQCSRPIDPRASRGARWLALKPDATMLGLHISQLMVPRREWGPHGWINWKTDILEPYSGKYGKVKFYNEILGLPCDDATRALTEADLRAACDESWSLVNGPCRETQTVHMWAGIDWGETTSRTVLTIGGFYPDGRFAPVFIKVYPQHECDPRFLIPNIVQWLHSFNVQAVACDVGHGWGMNHQLMDQFGIHRVFPLRYVGSKSPRLTFGDTKKYEWQVNRTQVLGEFFADIKNRKLRLPKWAMFEEHKEDFLAVFMEYVGRLKEMVYAHSPSDPDDRVHSMVYARLAAELGTGYGSFSG